MTRQTDFQPSSARARAAGQEVMGPAGTGNHGRNNGTAGGRRRPAGDPPSLPRAIPNISVHAFCESGATVEALQASGGDWRMAKVHLEVASGGIDAAFADCTGEGAPNVLVVETMLQPAQMLARLSALTDRCDPATKLIVIGQVNDIALYRELMKRGVGDYLIAPVSAAQFIDAVASLCAAPPGGRQPGSVMAFVGAKGGAGSSTVCHNVAWAMSETLKSDVVIADLDLAFGTAGHDFYQEAMQGMAEALQAPERLSEAALDRLLTRCSQHLSILAAPVALDRDYDISAGACNAVIEALRQRAAFVAVDLPHVWTPWLKQVLVQADEIILTAAPDLANLRNAKNLVDLLEASRPNGAPPRLVINMARRLRRPDISVEELLAELDLDPELVIEYDGETFGLAAHKGQMIEEFSRKARAAQQFRSLASALGQRAEPKQAARLSPLAPLFDKLRLRA